VNLQTAALEARARNLAQERENLTLRANVQLEAINARTGDDAAMTDAENGVLTDIRTRCVAIDTELEQLASDIESTRTAETRANELHEILVRGNGAVERQNDELAYPTFAAFARDYILSRESTECAKIAQQLGGEEVVRARERIDMLKARTPANTLSSNVGGLTPPQHIAQIFQVIDASRPLVASATKADLVRGQLTYPKVVTRPVVAVQASEKTEAGNQGMVVDMLTANASVYLGGGDLSWQAINWSTPSALDLWFQLAAADYALKTEQDAATVVTDSAAAHAISSQLGASPDFATFMAAVGAGASAVYANSQRMADTVYMAVDRYWYLFGLTSTPTAVFVTVSGQEIGPLQFVPSRGLDSGTIIVGDSEALLAAETPGAPVELRVVEPAIGGLEVGIIGGFESVVVDDGAFSLITNAS
jgi:hypothetical protein